MPAPRTKTRPIPKPRKSVKELVDYFERQRLPAPPSEWLQEIEQLNRPVPAPRTKRPVAAPRTKIPVAAPRMIKKTSSGTKDYNTRNKQSFKRVHKVL